MLRALGQFAHLLCKSAQHCPLQRASAHSEAGLSGPTLVSMSLCSDPFSLWLTGRLGFTLRPGWKLHIKYSEVVLRCHRKKPVLGPVGAGEIFSFTAY